MKKQDLAVRIDHTILKAFATKQDVSKLCTEAKEHGFASVCVNPCNVKQIAEELKGSSVLSCSVVGFPLGANTSDMKAAETKQAVADGADEIDMVINLGAMKAGDTDLVYKDIKAVVDAAREAGKAKHICVKVIIETCYLSEGEKILACQLSEKAGADFVKTSTGFGSAGASIEDVALMRKTVGKAVKVKASGGIRTLSDAKAMIEAGADRLGLSAGIEILAEI